VQAPFVFGSVHCRTLNGVTLARGHPTTQLCVLAQVQLLERPFRNADAARAANRYTSGARAGTLESPARAIQLVMVPGAAKAYTGEAAARPPGRGEGAEVLQTRTLSTDVRRVRRGGNNATQKTKLTTLCNQVAPSSVCGGPNALSGRQPRRSRLGANLHSPGGRLAAADSEMPPRAFKGSNDLAQAVGALTLAARTEEDSKTDALGLGAAKAHKEEERRKAEDKRRQDKKEAQRKLELETTAATAATTQQAAQLHEGLRGIRGTELEKRVQNVEASDATNRLVIAIVKEVRTIRQFKEVDAHNAITMVFASLALANTHACLMLAKLHTGNYCDLHPPQNKMPGIKIEYVGRDDEPTAEMVTKLLQEEGCTTVGMWQLGKDGRCEHPRLKASQGLPSVMYYSTANMATVSKITTAFNKKVDNEGQINLRHCTFRLAPLPPSGAFMVQMVVSAGSPNELSGNMWAMTAMGLSQIEIERCLSRIMAQTMDSSNVPPGVTDKFLGVYISSEVRRQQGQSGRASHQHPKDPLLKPRFGNEMIMTTPAAMGSAGTGQVAPAMYLMMSSVSAATAMRRELQEVVLQFPIGRAIKMTPVPEAPLMETGLSATQQRLQDQENAARRATLDWVQEVQECLKACADAPSNMLVVSKLATKMEEGKGLMTQAHPEASKLMKVILQHYDKGRETASEPNDWRKLYQELASCLVEVEKDMGLLDMRVTHATVTLLSGVAMRQLFTHFNFNPISNMPALTVNIRQALEIYPVGMQWCVVQVGGGLKLQGLQGEAPLLYLSMWEPLAEELRSRLTFNGNKATFDFASLTGKEIKAHIKLLADKMPDGESPVNLAQEMKIMHEAFDQGIAIFVPAITKTGGAILANTTLSDLKQLSEEEKKERPFDIRVWKAEDGGSEGRLQALQMLIKTIGSAWLCLQTRISGTGRCICQARMQRLLMTAQQGSYSTGVMCNKARTFKTE